jgi:hypothetical protein
LVAFTLILWYNLVNKRKGALAMSKNSKSVTVTSYVFSSILWLLGILTLFFNVFGLWGPWHLAGFGFIFFIPIPIISQIAAIICSICYKERKFIILNFVSLGITVLFIVVTVFISSGWFW